MIDLGVSSYLIDLLQKSQNLYHGDTKARSSTCFFSQRLFLKDLFRTRTTRTTRSFTEKSLKKRPFSVFSVKAVYGKEGDKDLRNTLSVSPCLSGSMKFTARDSLLMQEVYLKNLCELCALCGGGSLNMQELRFSTLRFGFS